MWSQLKPSANHRSVSTASKGSDQLDEMLAELSAAPAPRAVRAAASSSSSSAAAAASSKGATPRRNEDRTVVDETPAVQSAHEAIGALRLQLADPSVAERVNARLASAADQAAVLAYYEARPELSAYTCDRETTRNRYVIDGRVLEAPAAAARLRALAGRDEFLVRLANQSIFADSIAAFTHELHADAAFAAVANARQEPATFALRLGDGDHPPNLEAKLAVDVTVPTSAAAPPAANHSLSLATANCLVTVILHPTGAVVESRVDRPRLTNIFDADTLAAAASIAELSSLSSTTTAPPPAPDAAEASVIGGGQRFVAAAKRASSRVLQKVTERRDEAPVTLYRQDAAPM